MNLAPNGPKSVVCSIAIFFGLTRMNGMGCLVSFTIEKTTRFLQYIFHVFFWSHPTSDSDLQDGQKVQKIEM